MSFGSDRLFVHAALAAILWAVLPITSAAAQVTATCTAGVVEINGPLSTSHFNVRCGGGQQKEIKAHQGRGTGAGCDKGSIQSCVLDYTNPLNPSRCGPWTDFAVTCLASDQEIFCKDYADRAKAQNARNFAGACNLTGPAWDDTYANHYYWCTHLSPDGYKSSAQNEESNRDNALQQCKAPPAPGFGTASPSVSAAECQGYARTAVEQYRQYVARHCGPRSDRWNDDLKVHADWCMGASAADWQTAQFERGRELEQCRKQPAKYENLPGPGIDPRLPRCPPGTSLIGGACVAQRPGGGVSPSKDIPGSGKVEPIPKRNVCPPDRPVGAWPNCCPSGTSFIGGACAVPRPQQQQPGGRGSSTPKDTGSGKAESVPKPRTPLPKQQKPDDRAVPKPTIPAGTLLKCPTGQQRNSKGQCEAVFRAPR